MIFDLAFILAELLFEAVFYLLFARGSKSIWHYADREQTKRARLQRWLILRSSQRPDHFSCIKGESV